MKKIYLIFTFVCLCLPLWAQTFTWRSDYPGKPNDNWTTPSNWMVNGVVATTAPGQDASVVISNSRPVICSGPVQIASLTMSAGSLELGNGSMTVTSSTSISLGSINGGSLILRGSEALIAAPPTSNDANAISPSLNINARIDALCTNRIQLIGGTFSGVVRAEAPDVYFSRARFLANCTFIKTGTNTEYSPYNYGATAVNAYAYHSNSFGTLSNPVEVSITNKGSGSLFFSVFPVNRACFNQVNGNLTLNNEGSGTIDWSYGQLSGVSRPVVNGVTQFDWVTGSLRINSSSPAGGVYLGRWGGRSQLYGELLVNPAYRGNLLLSGLEAMPYLTDKEDVILLPDAKVDMFYTTFRRKISLSASSFNLHRSQFLSSRNIFEKTGDGPDTSPAIYDNLLRGAFVNAENIFGNDNTAETTFINSGNGSLMMGLYPVNGPKYNRVNGNLNLKNGTTATGIYWAHGNPSCYGELLNILDANPISGAKELITGNVTMEQSNPNGGIYMGYRHKTLFEEGLQIRINGSIILLPSMQGALLLHGIRQLVPGPKIELENRNLRIDVLRSTFTSDISLIANNWYLASSQFRGRDNHFIKTGPGDDIIRADYFLLINNSASYSSSSFGHIDNIFGLANEPSTHTIINRGPGIISFGKYDALLPSYNTVNGNLLLQNESTGDIHWSHSTWSHTPPKNPIAPTETISGNLLLENRSSGGIYIGANKHMFNSAGRFVDFTIVNGSVITNPQFNNGRLYIYNLRQQIDPAAAPASLPVNLSVGNARLEVLFSSFDGNTTFRADRLHFSRCTFRGLINNFVKTGSGPADTSPVSSLYGYDVGSNFTCYGNTFGRISNPAATTICNEGTGTFNFGMFQTSSVNAQNYPLFINRVYGDLLLRNMRSGSLVWDHSFCPGSNTVTPAVAPSPGIISGKLTLINESTGQILPAFGNDMMVQGDIEISNAAPNGIVFGDNNALTQGRQTRISGLFKQSLRDLGVTVNGQLTASAPPVFERLQINNDLELQMPVIIRTWNGSNPSLDLVKGRITTPAPPANSTLPPPVLIMEAGTGYQLNADRSSYVAGRVQKNGNTAFTFPVGSSTYYAPIGIAPSGGLVSDVFTAEHIAQNPSPLYPTRRREASLQYINQCYYWQLSQTNGSSQASVTLDWRSIQAPNCPMEAPTSFRIARWESTGSGIWQNCGNPPALQINTTQSTISSPLLNKFGVFSLGSVQTQSCLLTLPPDMVQSLTYNCRGVFEVKIKEGYSAYDWSDGGSGAQRELPPDIYTLTVSDEDGCTGILELPLQNTQTETVANLPSNTYQVNSALAVSVVNYSDIQLTEQEVSAGSNPYEDGRKGIWRPKSSYAYVEDRSSAAQTGNTPRVGSDGTFTLNMFDWKYSGELYDPHWRKINTITRYNAEGNELENRDIFNQYSAALFGYKGQLATAVAGNASYEEIAFESFEEYTTDALSGEAEINAGNISKGNLDICTEAGGMTFNRWNTYQVLWGDGMTAYIDKRLPNMSLASAMIEGVILDQWQATPFVIEDINVSLSRSATGNSQVAILSAVPQLAGRKWKGSISIYRPNLQSQVSFTADEPVVSKREAHTGSNSLKVIGNAGFKQARLMLRPNKQYVVSAWIKVPGLDQPTYDNKAGNNSQQRGIKVSFSNNQSLLFAPSGAIVEGWQRIEGSFCAEDSDFTLTLQAGPGEAYFDDLRLFPADGGMQSYVYDPLTYRLSATLDNNNYATIYHYDEEGNLFLVKKETARGIQTVQEAVQYIKPGFDQFKR